MGVIRNLVLGRWAAKWLLRGSPLAVSAKLAAVAVYGAWRWRRSQTSKPARPREIEADYEVLRADEAGTVAEPGSRLPGTGPPVEPTLEPE